jgi:hypothetical protein
MTSADHELIKIVSILRRKPNMTRKEYLDYHFQKHGKISDSPESLDDKPHKYRQYHIFDSAFGERPASETSHVPNRNHAWVGRDDATELYFRDMAHIQSVFSSEHVRTTVGPDGLNFSDLETAVAWIGHETPIPINSTVPAAVTAKSDLDSNTLVALYFISIRNADSELAKKLTAIFREEIEAHAADEALTLVVSLSPSVMESAEESLLGFDLTSYFGGSAMPKFPLYFKVTLKSKSSVAAIRKAQLAFETRAEALGLIPSDSIIAFAKQALVLDVGVPFDGDRQPRMDDLE